MTLKKRKRVRDKVRERKKHRKNAGVAERQTRQIQNRVPSGVGVQVPPPATDHTNPLLQGLTRLPMPAVRVQPANAAAAARSLWDAVEAAHMLAYFSEENAPLSIRCACALVMTQAFEEYGAAILREHGIITGRLPPEPPGLADRGMKGMGK